MFTEQEKNKIKVALDKAMNASNGEKVLIAIVNEKSGITIQRNHTFEEMALACHEIACKHIQ